MTPLDVRQSFCVMLHDVAPRFAPQVAEFTRTLSPLVGNAMSAAMVPCWDGEPLADRDRPFLERVRNEYANILLHVSCTVDRAARGSCRCSRRGRTR